MSKHEDLVELKDDIAGFRLAGFRLLDWENASADEQVNSVARVIDTARNCIENLQDRVDKLEERIRRLERPMSKHTPGPWTAEGITVWSARERRKFGPVADVNPRGDENEENADARLIAAAPELLHALRGHLAWYEGDTSIDEDVLIRLTRAAIAKAEAR